MKTVTKVFLKWRRTLFLSFILGFIVRLIPEVLFYPYLIGYDPIYYAWRIKSGVVWHHWSEMFSTWLFYAILIAIRSVTCWDLFVLLKFTAAFLFGLNASGIYYFATKALGWTIKKGLLAGVFFSLQIATLVLSSNFYRNMFGLGILLFALPLIKNGLKGRKRFFVFAVLSVLVVLSHEYSSVILFVVVLSLLAGYFWKRETKVNALNVLVAVSPALTLFLANFYFMTLSLPQYYIEKNVIRIHESKGNYHGVFFFLRNYLENYEDEQHSEFFNLASQVFSLFAGFYMLVLPFVSVGFFRDNVLDGWTTLLLVGSFGALLTPFFALDFWYRWMLMLVYPFTFYAVNGATKVLGMGHTAFDSTIGLMKKLKLVKIVMKLILILPFFLSLISAATAMQGRSVPLNDIEDAIKAIKWLNAEMDGGSVLITHSTFFNWARLYLDDEHTLIYFEDDVEGAVNTALQSFDEVYFIWWRKSINRHGFKVPDGFVSVFNSGRISVFMYNASGV
jgi:hypothetical protein